MGQKLFAVLAIGGVLLLAGTAEAQPFNGSASGWGVPASEIGTSGGGSSSSASGRSTLGSFTASGNGAVDYATFLGFCDVDGSDDPGEQTDWLFPYELLSQVVQIENGDQIFQELSQSRLSTLCLSSDASHSRLRFEIYTETVGGTGRFDGASGTSVSRGTGHNLSTMGGFSSTFEGEISLP